jgi:DHA3 family macrolide efflux protein-like MFS transporter
MKDKKNFWLYAMGRLVSLIGTGVQDIAVPLFILDLTGSGTAMGTFMIITTMPRLILVPIAGVIGDRVNRKLIMVWMDFGRGAVILCLAVLAVQNYITIPVLFVAQFLVSLMNALFSPATIAMLPDIVEDEDLTRANSILGTFNSLSLIVGPAMGGVICGLGGIKAAFLINGVSFIASGIGELFIRYQQETRKFGKVKDVIVDLREGIYFVMTHKGLLTLLVFALVLNFLAAPIFSVLVPYVMRIVIQFSSTQYGMLQTSLMVGVLTGNIIIGTLLAKSKVEKMLNVGLIAQSMIMLVFATLLFPQILEAFGYAKWSLFFALSLTFLFMGMFNAFVNTPITVELQRLAPTAFRARVFSIMGVTTQGIVPIGFGLMGIFLDRAPAYIVAFAILLIKLFFVLLFILKYSREVSKEFEHERRMRTASQNEAPRDEP